MYPSFFYWDANDFLLDFDTNKLMFARCLNDAEANLLYEVWRDEVFAQVEKYAN